MRYLPVYKKVCSEIIKNRRRHSNPSPLILVRRGERGVRGVKEATKSEILLPFQTPFSSPLSGGKQEEAFGKFLFPKNTAVC